MRIYSGLMLMLELIVNARYKEIVVITYPPGEIKIAGNLTDIHTVLPTTIPVKRLFELCHSVLKKI
ncbi:hypothetical protein GKR41_00032 [Candidatus Vallotia lariciata]|nr:hypothetical protein GKR41_00032 [Candidatus Vallotia lariciata]